MSRDMIKDAIVTSMRQAIGFLIVLYGLSVFFGEAMSELNNTATATFKTATTAAQIAESKLTEL